jgi:uncharacterized FlgJ-related protein
MSKNIMPFLFASMLFAGMEKNFIENNNSEKKELTPEEKAKREESQRKYELEQTKGDRNLQKIIELRKKNGLPPLKLGGE